MDQKIKIGIIGEFHPDRPSHNATNQALNHAAEALSINLDITWLRTQPLENDSKIRETLGLLSYLLIASLWLRSFCRSLPQALNSLIP